MSGKMLAPGFQFIGTSKGVYASTDYKAWNFIHQRMKKSTIQISLSNEESARTIGSQSKDSSFFILHSSLTKHSSRANPPRRGSPASASAMVELPGSRIKR